MDRARPSPGGRVIAAIKERGHLGWATVERPALRGGQPKLRVIYEGGHNLPAPRFAGVFIMSRRVQLELLFLARGWGWGVSAFVAQNEGALGGPSTWGRSRFAPLLSVADE
jgi:hypothetical protein